MLSTTRCWWQIRGVDDTISILMISFKCWSDANFKRYRVLLMETAKTVTNISTLSLTHFVFDIRNQHQCSPMKMIMWQWSRDDDLEETYSWAIGRKKSEIKMNKWFDLESMFPSQDSFVSFLAIDFSKNDLFFAFKHNFLSFSMSHHLWLILYESYNMARTENKPEWYWVHPNQDLFSPRA